MEDWTIENLSTENHVFHIHQMHFQHIATDGVQLSPKGGEYFDTIEVPHMDGDTVHSVTIRMDFTGE